MRGVYIALRHEDPKLPEGVFAKLIRWRLVTQFPHGGIVIGDTLRPGLPTQRADLSYNPDGTLAAVAQSEV